MNLKNYKAIAQDEHSYTVQHPSGKKLFIEKAKLTKPAHEAILHLYQGAQVGGGAEEAPTVDLSAMGGGDPMASIMKTPVPAAGAADPVELADEPDDAIPVREDKITDFSKAASQSRLGITAAEQAGIDSIPLPKVTSVTPEQAVAQSDAMAKVDGRSPDGSAAGESSMDPLVQDKMDVQSQLQQQMEHEKTFAEEQEAANNKIAAVQEASAKEQRSLPTQEEIFNKYQTQDAKFQQAVIDGKVDPQRIIHNMGTGSKIVSGIAMILSGMGAATTGQPNLAMKVLDDAIERDIDAQKNDQTKNLSVWKMNREALGNDMAANLATKNQMLGAAQMQLQAAQTQALNPANKLRAQQAIDQIKGQMIQNNLRRSLLTQGQNEVSASGQSGLSKADPASLVPEMVKDPSQQKQVYDEIKGRQNIAKNGDKMLSLFDQAAKDTSGTGAVTSMMYEPGSIIGLKQLMLPNFDKIDGTVRQATMDASYSDILPKWNDTPARIAAKRQALQDWMHSNASAPISKGNYIDLDRFSSTAMPKGIGGAPKASAGAEKAQPQTATMHGHNYVKVQGGWKLVK